MSDLLSFLVGDGGLIMFMVIVILVLSSAVWKLIKDKDTELENLRNQNKRSQEIIDKQVDLMQSQQNEAGNLSSIISEIVSRPKSELPSPRDKDE
jgi:hypothetical protein